MSRELNLVQRHRKVKRKIFYKYLQGRGKLKSQNQE